MKMIEILGDCSEHYSIDSEGDVLIPGAVEIPGIVTLKASHGDKIGTARVIDNGRALRLRASLPETPKTRLGVACGGLSCGYTLYESELITGDRLKHLWRGVNYRPTRYDENMLRTKGLFRIVRRARLDEVSLTGRPKHPQAKIDLTSIVKSSPVLNFRIIPADLMILSSDNLGFFVAGNLTLEKRVPLYDEQRQRCGIADPNMKAEIDSSKPGVQAARLLGEGYYPAARPMVEPLTTRFLSDLEVRRMWDEKGYTPTDYDRLVVEKHRAGVAFITGKITGFELSPTLDGALKIITRKPR